MIKDLENEIWETHPKYNWMAASNLGRIKSLERDVVAVNGKVYHYEEKLIKLQLSKGGYLQFDICKDNKIIASPYAHRFVYECFHKCILPKGCSELQINHKNEDKTDNRVFENLELCTPQYNVEYSQAKTVGQYDLNGNLIKIWKSTMKAEREGGFNNAAISKCCNGKRKTHKGFIWQYIYE